MKNQYLPCLPLLLLLLTGQAALAQAPTITALSPTRNLRNAPSTSNVAITFDQPISSGTATLGALRVFSQQRGGLLRNGQGGITSASSNTLTFNPTTNFRPGETIFTTVTTGAQSSTGTPLGSGHVHQFTVGTGGTGRGNFTPPATNPNPAVGGSPSSVVLGDVDGDGDLDLLTANSASSTVSVLLNDGAGSFTGNTQVAVSGPNSVALGDVDGDGDLDFVTANENFRTVSVRLNNGLGNFTPHPTNPNPALGFGPSSVALGDVDGDGDLDLLTANRSSNTVSVRLNDGSGNFTLPTNPNFTVGSSPRSLALGDVDGDGDLDLLTANNSSSNVSVLLNDGSGNFFPGSNPAVSFGPFSVALGDVDGDGDLDFITANQSTTFVSVRLNDGSGNFAPGSSPGVGGQPISVALGDVDGDGDLDLLTANSNNSSNNVSVRLNDGSGNFAPPATNSDPAVGSQPYSVALGDVDSDGDLDFIAANATSNTVSVRLNQPPVPVITALSPTRNLRNAPSTSNVAITFDQPISSGTATLGALRVFSQQRGGLLRNGQGGITTASSNTLTFNPTTNFRPGETIFTTVTTGAQSSAGVNLNRGHVHQFTVGTGGTGRGNFTPPATNPDPTVGSEPYGVAQGDVDGDGDLDLLTANSASNTVSVRLNNGTGNFTPHPTNAEVAVSVRPQSVALGDVDGDGDLDFITANSGNNTVSVRLNNGTGNFTPHPTNAEVAVGDSPQSVALGDVDGDGDLDFITANATSNTVSVRLNNGSGSFVPPGSNAEVAVGFGPFSVALGDVDGDGDLDFITANSGNNTVSVRLNNGSGSFAPPGSNPNPAVGSVPRSVALGDVDGDGDLDLLTANFATSNVSVRINNGAGSFTGNTQVFVGSQPLSVVLGDVDGDGDLDFITTNFDSNNVTVRLNNGSGIFTAPAINPNFTVGSGPRSVALGDVDGDGDLDLLTANAASNNVSVRLNQPLDLAPTIIGFNTLNNPVCVGSPITFTATVGNVSPPYAFTLSNGSNTIMGNAGSTAFSQVLTASGSGLQTFTLTVNDGGPSDRASTGVTVNPLPNAAFSGLAGPYCADAPPVTLVPTTSGGQFSGPGVSGTTFTPANAGTGGTVSYSVTVGECSNTSQQNATVNPLPTAGLTNDGPLSCSKTNVTLTASDAGSGATYNFSGPGLSQSGASTTALVSSAGTYSLTVTAAGGCSATATSSVTSNMATVSVINPTTNTTVQGVSFSQSFSASGGTGPYSFSLASGSLPTGLSLSGSGDLSGTPTQAGSYTITVSASDANGCSGASASYTLTITPAPDLTPIIFVHPSIVYNTKPISVVTDVYEINSVNTTGLITLRITKDNVVSLRFDPTATSVGGRAVSNASWTFSQTASYYQLTTTSVITGGDVLSVGLSGTLTPGATRGNLGLSANVMGGGETRFDNNTATTKIDYFPNL